MFLCKNLSIGETTFSSLLLARTPIIITFLRVRQGIVTYNVILFLITILWQMFKASGNMKNHEPWRFPKSKDLVEINVCS